jgi:hypothetical protein
MSKDDKARAPDKTINTTIDKLRKRVESEIASEGRWARVLGGENKNVAYERKKEVLSELSFRAKEHVKQAAIKEIREEEDQQDASRPSLCMTATPIPMTPATLQSKKHMSTITDSPTTQRKTAPVAADTGKTLTPAQDVASQQQFVISLSDALRTSELLSIKL